MLNQETLVAMLGTTDPSVARAFYEGVLGLTFVAEHPTLTVFDSGGTRLMIAHVEAVLPRIGTALGWEVRDLRAVIRALVSRGVTFERYEGMDQDEDGVWQPAGPDSGVCWFKDPDGNLLSLSQAAVA